MKRIIAVLALIPVMAVAAITVSPSTVTLYTQSGRVISSGHADIAACAAAAKARGAGTYGCDQLRNRVTVTVDPVDPPQVDPPPVVVVPPSSSAFYVYRDGAFNWGGHFDFALTQDNRSTECAPAGATYGIKAQTTGMYGGLQLYSPGYHFDSRPFSRFVFTIKPQTGVASYGLYFEKRDYPAGNPGVVDGGKVTVPDRLFSAPAGQWTEMAFPLAEVINQKREDVYKFAIQVKGSGSFCVGSIRFE